MNPQSILSICIPTYNRAECLRQILDKMIPVCKENNILIYISDNASPDNTEEVGIKYASDYDFIHYHRHTENIGPDDNFEFVLKMADTKYRWLMSDTCYVDDIVDLMEVISDYDLDACIVTDPLWRKSRSWFLPKEMILYDNSIDVMQEMGWHLTWISCMIYNKRLVESFDFMRYKNSSFNQTALIFEPTANKICKICYNPKVTVSNLPSQGKESGWHYQVFDVMYRQWYLLIMSLPLYYPYEIKKKCIEDNARLPLMLNNFYHLKRRSEGKWTIGDLYRNRFFVKQSKADYFFLFLIGILPRPLVWIFYHSCNIFIRSIGYIKRLISDKVNIILFNNGTTNFVDMHTYL